MTTQEYKQFSQVLKDAPKPSPLAAAATAQAVERAAAQPVRETVMLPQQPKVSLPVQKPVPAPSPISTPEEEPEQTVLPMPKEIPWRIVGELYRSYILVEQGEEAYLIDKHAAHERILFDKLKSHPESISAQALLTPVTFRTSPEAVGTLLSNRALLDNLGFEIEEFGTNTLLVRQIPMDLAAEDVADTLDALSSDLLAGRNEAADTVRDELLHTVACKAAIKAGWHTDEKELQTLVQQVMSREELKHCPHGRPICITLSKKQLEKQFKRS